MVKFIPPACFRVLFVLGLLMPAVSGVAQQLQPAPADNPAIVWLTPAQAQIQLKDKLDVLQPQLAGLTPGTTPHTDLLRRIIFYKSILLGVIKEIPVPKTIEAALPEAASMGGVYEQTFTPEAMLRLLYDEAVDLLSNN